MTPEEDLKSHRLERAGIERMLTIIGEAAKKISPELAREYAEIPWREAAGMRRLSTTTSAWTTKQYS